MIRLEKLTLRKLGNIALNTELHFNDRGALLLGKNGTGKTTLLNVIAAVLRSDWQKLFSMGDRGFDLDYALRVATHPESSVRLDVTMSGTPLRATDFWRLRAEADLHRRGSLTVSVRDSAESRLLAIVSENHRTTFSYADGTTGARGVATRSPGEGLRFGDDNGRSGFDGAIALGEQLITFGEQLQRYDEALSYFDRLTRDQATSPPLVTFFHRSDPPEATTFQSHLLSSPTCEALRRELVSARQAPEDLCLEARLDHELSDHASAPWLTRFCQLTGIAKVSLLFPLVFAKRTSSTTVAQYGPMSLHYSTRRGTLREDQLSFGQKRLFALLHYLDAHASIVLADELVHGLHHKWSEPCVQALNDRQAFLSSQNPILFDFTTFTSVEEATGRFIECSLDEQGRFVWHNMSIDDAAELYELYQTGIQRVSDILRTEGIN